MFLCLVYEEAANTLLTTGLLDVVRESYIIEKYKVQKASDQRCFKCQKCGHLVIKCGGPTICGNYAKNGHTH